MMIKFSNIAPGVWRGEKDGVTYWLENEVGSWWVTADRDGARTPIARAAKFNQARIAASAIANGDYSQYAIRKEAR